MTDFSPETLASVTPTEFAAIVRSTPDSTIKDVLAGPDRDKILDGVFDRMPTLFRADKAGDTRAIVHWNVTGGPDTDRRYETVIADGACVVTHESVHEPELTMIMDALTLLKVVSGTGNPVVLFMTGKVKAKGNVAVAANLAKLFDIPKD